MSPSAQLEARSAKETDADAIARIYNEGIEDRSATFETTLRTAAVGVYEKHAQLDGAWRDVVIVERLIPANVR